MVDINKAAKILNSAINKSLVWSLVTDNICNIWYLILS